MRNLVSGAKLNWIAGALRQAPFIQDDAILNDALLFADS